MKNENKEETIGIKFEEISTFKKIRYPFIMSIVTFIFGILLSYESIGFSLGTRIKILLVSFLPFILFCLIIFAIYKFKKKRKVVSFLKNTSIVMTFFLVFYLMCFAFFVTLLEVMNPTVNPKYYSYYINGSRLKKAFPTKIPKDVESVKFFYMPGILQGGTRHTLYYVDKNMTVSEFDKVYKDKAEWIGHIDEYIEKEGLLSSVFYYTPSEYNNENDYIIYLIEGHCDNSRYCNHGDYLIAAYNEKTNEVVFSSEVW